MDRLLEYCEQVIRWNTRTNLTGAKDVLSFLRGPLFDALTLIPVLADHIGLLDVGTGAGLPGIPAKLLRPEMKLTLLEPRTKRVEFLEHTAKALPSTTVIKGKHTVLEEGVWTAAVSQAVWAPTEWLERGHALSAPGGAIYTLCSSEVEYDTTRFSLEAEYQTHRPVDGAPRYAYRFKKS